MISMTSPQDRPTRRAVLYTMTPEDAQRREMDDMLRRAREADAQRAVGGAA